MKYIKGIQAYQDQSPSAITLGKFDGLHLGHQLLVSRIIEHQKYDGVVGIVFGFDMTPMLKKFNQPYQMLLTNAPDIPFSFFLLLLTRCFPFYFPLFFIFITLL